MRPALRFLALLCAAAALLAPGAALRAATNAELAAQVRAAETAFAKTMADRDLKAFATFVGEDAVFVGRNVLRGRDAVVAGWTPLYDGPKAPFSWQPELVEVLDSGTLALSSGPVFDPDGKRSGTFTSTWRLDKDGKWRVVLDKGCPPCNCGEPEKK